VPLPSLGVARRTALEDLRVQAGACTACELYRHATQTVFGEGPITASVVLLGEQPGDHEDRAGRPFVGPAGAVLDRALADAQLDRRAIYVSNVVKHFKFVRSGKVRLHQKPNAAEVRACRPWWEAELAAIQPHVVCCLGATAGQAVLGSRVRVTRDRGRFVPLPFGPMATVTIHPSAVLRADDRHRSVLYDGLVADLSAVAARVSDA
jgi:uracil-DNA glycosylase